MFLKTNARFVFPANRDGSLGVHRIKVPVRCLYGSVAIPFLSLWP